MPVPQTRGTDVDLPAKLVGMGAADAYSALITSLHGAALEVSRIKRDSLPGLLEAVETDLVIAYSDAASSALGWFACNAWQLGTRPVSEIYINADRRSGHRTETAAEDVLVTLVHELVHLFNSINGVRDTSNRGRYHNRRFTEPALEAGLEIQWHPVAQHVTPRLRPSAAALYAEVLAELDQALVLVRHAADREEPVGSGSAAAGVDAGGAEGTGATAGAAAMSKYVSAQCSCRHGRGRRRTLRMAAGSWRQGPVICGVCGLAFSAGTGAATEREP